jgi:hypothetical protein
MLGLAALSVLMVMATRAVAEDAVKIIRIGIIGMDTSHVPAFTRLFNDPKATGDLAGFKVVAAFPGGSADIPSSIGRVPEYTAEMKKMGVEIVDSIPALLEKVDCVLLESVDGRPHLEQVRPVFAAHKPVYIDKPLAGSLADAIAIVELGKKSGVPWFSSSSLRFSSGFQQAREKFGEIRRCDAWSPCSLEPHHPDLYWYGVHGVEILYTIMGPGCQSVVRGTTDAGEITVTGYWPDGRIGTFTAKKDYGAKVVGSKGEGDAGKYEGYKPLCVEIGKFFKNGKPPVAAEETLEIMAFMEAADQSKRENGAKVTLESVMAKASQRAK